MSSERGIMASFLEYVTSTWQLFLLFRDLTIANLNLMFWRLLPDLKPPPRDLTGKTVIITGGSSGIGQEIAVELARQHATVYVVSRGENKLQKAVEHITERVPSSLGHVKSLKCDVSDLQSVHEFARQWSTLEHNAIDILIHNLGIPGASPEQALTRDGIDTVYATNLLGPFLLTHLLESYLSSSARVIFTSSASQYLGDISSNFSLGPVKGVSEPGFHYPAPSKFGLNFGAQGNHFSYANTKIMQNAFARILQQRFDSRHGSGGTTSPQRSAHAFAPGFTQTPAVKELRRLAVSGDLMYRTLMSVTWLALSVDQGAATGVWLATTSDQKVVGSGGGGRYWDRMTRRVSRADILSQETLDRLWIRWERDAGIEWR